MDLDSSGMSVLSRAECLQRLGRGGVGRVAVTVSALPAIFPVNYAMRAEDVYFRTGPGTKLAAAVRHAVVAFEIDAFDGFSHGGWSVQVVGIAAPVDDADELEVLRTMPLTPWVGGGADTLVRIHGALISGRELTRVVRNAWAPSGPARLP